MHLVLEEDGLPGSAQVVGNALVGGQRDTLQGGRVDGAVETLHACLSTLKIQQSQNAGIDGSCIWGMAILEWCGRQTSINRTLPMCVPA